MRRLIIPSLLLCAAFIPGGAHAYTSPGAPVGFVNDFAHVLSAETESSLSAQLAAFQASTSNEIAVVTIQSLQGDYIEHYAVELFEEWGIGGAEQDNGVLLLLAIADRKLRIEVGYGLEGALPDSVAQDIINGMTPLLREKNYDDAVALGVSSVVAATQGEYAGEGNSAPAISFDLVWAVLFGVFFALQWGAAILARSKSWWAGGIAGLAIGLGIGLFFAWAAWAVGALALVLGAAGLLLDYLVSGAYTAAKRAGGGSIPWWAGGGSAGPHSSGGGFGGFGGGSSGGGGASGSW